MRKLVLSLGVLVVVLGAALYLFRDPLLEVVADTLTADMFVDQVADTVATGPAVGDAFPALRARHDGNEIRSIAPFIGERGLVFIANRSVEW